MLDGHEILGDTRLLIILIGLIWSALLALARRAVLSVERKIDETARKTASLQTRVNAMIGETKYRMERDRRETAENSRGEIKDLSRKIDEAASVRLAQLDRIERDSLERAAETERRMAEKIDSLRRQTVTRHEFRLLVSNLHDRVEAIYNHIIKSGAKA